jgi:antitoxin component YwqK of YwqJK toxin-antitoxin module
MNMKYFFICLCLCVTALSVQAQIQISDIEISNLSEGQLSAQGRKDGKPLNGRMRIITGNTTDYIDAGFTDGYADGKWEYFKNNTLSESKSYSKGYVNGEVIKYYSDGTTIYTKENMKNGKVDGKSFAYYGQGDSDAYRKTAYYKNGVLDGEYSEEYDNGTVRVKGKYIDGKKDGVWTKNKPDGSPQPTEEFKNDAVIKRITYFTNGKIEMERNFDADGKRHGAEKKYDWEDGALKSELNYVHGKQVGKQIRYMSSNAGNYIETAFYNEAGLKDGEYSEIFIDKNRVKAKGQYTKDKKHGKWVYGYGNGTLYKEEIYDEGKLLDTK